MARSLGITRERVIEVAADLADQHGFEALTLAQVAAQLQVKLPSLYNHIDGLAGLRHALTLLGCRELAERLRDATIGKSEDTAVLALAHAYRGYVLEHPGRYAATIRAPADDDLEFQQLSRLIVGIVVAVLEPYGLQGDHAIHAVRGLRSIAHGFATIEQVGGFGLALNRDESFERLIRGYIAGIRAMQG